MTDETLVVKLLIRNEEGEFLAVRERESGKWELPGGKIEDDEDRFEAGRRELEEETGIEVSEERFKDVVRVEVEDMRCVNCWIMFAETKEEEIELYKEELAEFRWVTADEYPGMNWHAYTGYGVPAMRFLDEYLEMEKSY